MYHVDLDLSPDQVRQLHQLALDRGLKVRVMVTQMVESAIISQSTKCAPDGKKPSKVAK